MTERTSWVTDMRTITASVFKAKCLQLLDLVNETNEEIVITKNGKPVSKLLPYRKRLDTLFGLHKHSVKSCDDLVTEIGDHWDVE